MVIQFPYVVFRWHNPNRGICGIEDYITDIEKKRYGFNLMAGTKMYCITYDGLRRGFIMYHCKVDEINEAGILVTDWMEKGWNTDNAQREGFILEDGNAFLPWKMDDAVLQIEPCPSLYENYKVKDLIDRTARIQKFKEINGKMIPDRYGIGLFYQHGGCRTHDKYECNFEYIVKLGQMELDL